MTTRRGAFVFELARAGRVEIQSTNGPDAIRQLIAQHGDDTLIPSEAGGESPLMHTMLTWSGALIPNGGFDSRARRLSNSLNMNVALPEQVFRPNGEAVPTIEAKAAGLIPPSETPEERQIRFDREDIAIRPELANQPAPGGPGFDAPSAVIPGPEPTVQPGGETGITPRQQPTRGGGGEEPFQTIVDDPLEGVTFQQASSPVLRYENGRWFREDTGEEIVDNNILTQLNEAFRNHPQFRENNSFSVTDIELDNALRGGGQQQATGGQTGFTHRDGQWFVAATGEQVTDRAMLQQLNALFRNDERFINGVDFSVNPLQLMEVIRGQDPEQSGLPAEAPAWWPRSLPYPPRGDQLTGQTPQDQFFDTLQNAAAGGFGSEFIAPAQQFLGQQGQGQAEIVEMPVGDGTATFIRQPSGNLVPFNPPGQGPANSIEQQIVRDLVDGSPDSIARAQQLFRLQQTPDPATVTQTALNLAQSPADAFSVSSILRGDISPRLDAGPIGQGVNRVGPVADFVQSSLANFFQSTDPFSNLGGVPSASVGVPEVVNPALQGATERDIENADILNQQARQQGIQIPSSGPNAPAPGQTLGSPVNISPEAIALIEGAGLDVPTYLEFLQTRGGPAMPQQQNTLMNTILNQGPTTQPTGSLLSAAGIPIPGAQTQRNLSPTEFGALQGLTQLAGISQAELERELRAAIPISRPALRRQPFPNLGIRV